MANSLIAMNSPREVVVLWSIKGYHFFRIRPYEEIPLIVIPEENNTFDENAMMIKMPKHVPDILLNAVTRKGDNKQKAQRVKDILGKQVGRVPANLCRVFRSLLKRNMLENDITCYYGGNVGHSKNPHFQQAFKKARTRQGKDRPGGGAELNCTYFLQTNAMLLDIV